MVTKRILGVFVLIVLIGASIAGASNTFVDKSRGEGVQTIDAAEIKNMIKEKGARKTVQKLYGDMNVWKRIMGEIGTGKREWLEIAVLLQPGSDAGSAEMIDIALGEALKNAPDLVLGMISDGGWLNMVCGSIDDGDQRYSSLEKSVDDVQKRIRAVSTVKDPKLQDPAKRCIAQLERLIQSLHKYFEESED